MNCRICGNQSQKRVCNRCNYFLKYGATEETIKNMLSDSKTQKIWDENKKISMDLANAYYRSTIENYEIPKKTSKEDFGYNTFIEGIRLGLDIIIPMLDDESRNIIIEKIKEMISIRKANKEKKHF